MPAKKPPLRLSQKAKRTYRNNRPRKLRHPHIDTNNQKIFFFTKPTKQNNQPNKMNKSTLKIAAFTIIALACGINKVSAQASATASASANIVTPITITKNVDMNFGNVAVQALTGGTVVMDTVGARTPTAGVTLPAVAGTVAAAEFTIAGQASYTYAITLPASVTIYDAGSAHNMVVDNFTSNPTSTGALSTGGTETLQVGATLNVGAGQAAGAYTSSTPFTVTVNYN
jgi:hypothetical protein